VCKVLKQILECLEPYEAAQDCSDTVASPGTMLVPALSSDKEQQQQHILTPVSANDALA
jgi:hypothetical protein